MVWIESSSGLDLNILTIFVCRIRVSMNESMMSRREVSSPIEFVADHELSEKSYVLVLNLHVLGSGVELWIVSNIYNVRRVSVS